MAEKSLQVVIFSSMAPRNLARLITRIEQEVSGARVCGVLYERRPPKNRSQRLKMYLQKIRRPGYLRYTAARVLSAIRHRLTSAADLGLRLVHASPAFPNGRANWGLAELSAFCSARGGKLLVTPDIHSSEALEFVRGLQPELGLIYGTRILKPSLFTIPTRGSVNIHKRKVPDYRGGGPVGLWEMLDGQTEIGVTVHRVEAQVDTGAVVCAATIAIDPFDNLESLALKAQVVGDDLLVQAVRDFRSGTVQEIPQVGPSRVFKNPAPEQLRQYECELRGGARRSAGRRAGHRGNYLPKAFSRFSP